MFVNAAWRELSSDARLVLYRLRDMANHGGNPVTVTVPALASVLGLSQRHIYRTLAELKKTNHVRAEHQPGGASTYYLVPYAERSKRPTAIYRAHALIKEGRSQIARDRV